MRAIVLAGGFGTRLKSLLPNLPKPMAPVNGTPFLEIILKTLSGQGFHGVILSVGYMSDSIINYFGNSFCGMKIEYVIENEPLGTGGAIKLCMDMVSEDFVFVMNGDTYAEIEYRKMVEDWEVHKSPILATKFLQNTDRYGTLDIYKGNCVGFSEKSQCGNGYINVGTYLIGRDERIRFPNSKSFSFEYDYLGCESLLSRYRVFELAGKFIDIGVPDDYLKAQELLKKL